MKLIDRLAKWASIILTMLMIPGILYLIAVGDNAIAFLLLGFIVFVFVWEYSPFLMRNENPPLTGVADIEAELDRSDGGR